MHGIRVRVAAAAAGPVTGHYALPAVGEFGLVAFYANDSNSGVWVTNLPSRLWNAEPREILKADPKAVATYHRDGRRELHTGAGDHEIVYPDGTLLRLTASKDESVSNTGNRSLRTPMTRTVDADPGSVSREQQREEYSPPETPPLDIRLEHSSGATITITADGSFDLVTPKGHRFKLHDATEKARDADGNVLQTPEEDASRVASEVMLESEQGHQILLHDDPVSLLNRHVTIRHAVGHEVVMKDDPNILADQHVTVRTAGGHELELRDLPTDDIFMRLKTNVGHQLELRDAPAADQYIQATTLAGHMLELRDTPTPKVTVSTAAGRSVVMDDDATVTTVTDPVRIEVDAPLIELAGGGAAVARVGDAVSVNPSTGVGTITAGSAVVQSG